MTHQHDPSLELEQQQIEVLILEAQTLAESSKWRETAKSMRMLRRKLKELEHALSPEQTHRFQQAQQIFMNRRAEWFASGNQQKRENIQQSVNSLQQQILELKESISASKSSLDDFKQQLLATQDQPHQEQIQQFIKESIKSLAQEIAIQTKQLQYREDEINRQTAQYCGP